MSLPWFPFHIDKFLSDTLALDGEAIGAYVLLMLHYYATETPPRDNDRALATIARLPMDRWMDRRPEIAACFDIRDGAWHHPTIEAEIADAKAKHAASNARASAAGHARWANRPPKPARSTARAVPQASAELAASMKTAPSNAPSTTQALPGQSPSNGHLTITESLSVDVLTVEKDNSGDNSAYRQNLPEAGGGFVDAAFPQNDGDFPQKSVSLDIGTPIDPKFWPCENHISACRFDGADDTIIKREVDAFVAVKQQDGALSKDWDASWSLWWKRWKDHRDALAAKEAAKAAPKPRIEVSNRIDWDTHAKRFAGGMGWPRGVGPDPDSPACRCPPDILERHGIAVLATVKEKT